MVSIVPVSLLWHSAHVKAGERVSVWQRDEVVRTRSSSSSSPSIMLKKSSSFDVTLFSTAEADTAGTDCVASSAFASSSFE